MLVAVEIIKRAGLAEEWRQKPGYRGWQSTLTAAPVLAEIFDMHNQKLVYGPREPIILRARKDDSLLPLPPMRDRQRQIEAVNEMLRGIRLDLSMTGALELQNGLWLFKRCEYDKLGNPLPVEQIVRLDRMAGRRIFTNKTRFHGRFYCPAQNIPGTARLLMTMGGEHVVELDFQSMHVALAYHLCGARLDGDPYEGIAGFTREQAKLGLLTCFNAKTTPAAIASLTDARKRKPVVADRKDALRLIEALKARHAPIASKLGRDAGMTFMNLDARIMLAAVNRLISMGIQCIPIHDSIVVPAQYESESYEALNYGWCAILKGSRAHLTPCKIDKKRPKVSQYGCAPSDLPAGPLSDPGSGWWSSILAEARCDVGEWVSV